MRVTLALKFVVGVKLSVIFVVLALRLPSENALSPGSFAVGTNKLVVPAFLFCISIEGVILESTDVGHEIRFIHSFGVISNVIIELSFVVGTIREDKHASALGFAMIEVSDVHTTVWFIHFPQSMGYFLLLDKLGCTSSRSPT